MQKVNFKRVLSLFVCLAVLVTGIPFGILALPSPAPNIIVDDFESGAVNWIRDDMSSVDATRITAQSATNSNKVFKPIHPESGASIGSVKAYTYAGEVPNKKIVSVSGKFSVDMGHSLVLIYYYKDENNWRGAAIGGGGQWIRYVGEQKLDGEDAIYNDFIAYDAYSSTGGTFTSNYGLYGASIIDFTINYADDGTATMVVSRTHNGALEQSKPIPLLTAAKGEFVKINANEGKFAFGKATNGTAWLDDIVMTYNKTDGQVIEEFKVKHAVILAKDVATATDDDRDLISAALSDYEIMDESAKALLSTEYAKLVELENKIISVQFSGGKFTDDFSSYLYWQQVGKTSSVASPITADGQFYPSTSKDAANGEVSIHTHKYWPNREVESVTGKYRLAGKNGAGSLLVYYYKDPNNWRGFYIQRAGAFNMFQIMKETDPLDPSRVYYKKAAGFDKQCFWVGENPEGGTVLDFKLEYTAKGSINLTFTHGNPKENILEMTISDALTSKAGQMMLSTDGGKTFSPYTETEAGLQQGIHKFEAITDGRSAKFGMGHGQGNISTFDDITVRFVLTTDEKIAGFKSENAEILGKTEATVQMSDKEILIGAFDAYAELSSEAKAGLVNELEHLNKLAYALAPESKAFIEKYQQYWSKTAEDMTFYDREDLAKAVAEFDTLSDFAKEIIADKKVLLDELYTAAMNKFEPRDPDDFSDFDADFENGVLPFRNNSGNIPSTSDAKIVVDPTDPTGENHVFLFRNGSSGQMTFIPAEELWNKQATMKTISLRIYMDGLNVFAPPVFIYDYRDAENMRGVYFSNTGAFMLYSMEEGIAGQKIIKAAPFLEDFQEGWVKYNFTFAGNKTSVVVELPNGTSEAFSLDKVDGARIGFRSYTSWGHIGKPAYFDDIHVTMTKGDFDVNDTIEDISVYYSENALIYPNETILLSGERLGETIESVQINRLSDVVPADTDKAAYIKETNYDRNGEYNGLTQPTAATWNSATAKNVEILQTTKNSIKVVVPKEYETGIYVLKLTPKSKNAADVILYVNDPFIRTIIGDEGEVATRGGYIRILGNNMIPKNSATDVRVQLKNAAGETFNLPVTKFYEDDNYSLECAVPENFAYGEYEVFVYNGYGDETAWSAPHKVTIGAKPRDSWPKEVFNVKDFGAVGDTQTNDTPAIVNALNAAAANGGGIVYFPKTNGAYRVITTLAIPDNTVIKGEGTGNSQIMWSTTRWQYTEVPPLMTIKGNTEIIDIGLYTSRGGQIITTTGKYAGSHTYQDTLDNFTADNIYIRNVKIRTQWSSGMITQGGGGNLVGTGKETVNDVRNHVLAEMANKSRIGVSHGGAQNLQIENVDLIDAQGSTAYGVHTNHEYTQIRGCRFETGWHHFSAINGLIYEDNEHTRAAVGAIGVGVYIARNYMHHNMQNNRELFTIDGQPFAQNMSIQFIGQREDIMGKGNTDEVTYKVVGKSYKDDSIVGYEVMIGYGQGLGQVRRIVKQKGDTFVIDRPFTVAPNRNSRVWFIVPRHGWFFVDNYFEEGAACGTSGTLVDAVWDKNYYTLHGGQKFATRDGPNWYLSMVNQVMEDPWYMHGEGIGYDCTFNTFSRVQMHAMNAFCSEIVIGWIWRRNNFGEYYIMIQRAPYYSGIRDMILENNIMYGVEHVIESGEESVSHLEGTLIRDNDFEVETTQMFTGQHFNAGQTELNKYGSPRCLMVYSDFDPSGNNLGDVNADGKVNLKDSTMIRLSIFGLITLTRDQIVRADVNKDSSITMKDANRIRKYLLEGIPLDADLGGGGTSSDSSSSDDSSSGGSSSGSSSDSSSDSSSGSSSSDAGFIPGVW